ncbi:MFS transporter [Alteromonas gracilis]
MTPIPPQTQRPYRRVWSTRGLAVLTVTQTAAALSFYVPVSAIYLQYRGLSFTQIFWLESILLASILLTEIPAGAIADRIDRRWAIIAGYLANAVAEVLFFLGQDFGTFAFSFALSGLGIALLSGVEEAYVYETLGDTADDDIVGVSGHMSALGIGAGVVASVVGGALASRDITLPALVSAVVAVAAAVVAFVVPPRAPEVDEEDEQRGSVTRSLKLILASPVLLYVAVAASTGYVLFNAVYVLNQPIFQARGIPLAWFGIIVAIALLVAAVCNHYADVIEQRLGRAMTLFLATAVGAIGFLAMAVPHVAVVLGGFLMVIVGMNARGPVMGAVAHKLLPNSQRATALSVMSSLGSLAAIAANPVIGWGADRSPEGASIGLGVTLMIMAGCWLPIAKRYLDDQEPEDSPSDEALDDPRAGLGTARDDRHHETDG